jgi:hypothetical protein
VAEPGADAMSDQARFWMWIVMLALTCLVLGAVLASVARAQADEPAASKPHGSVSVAE